MTRIQTLAARMFSQLRRPTALGCSAVIAMGTLFMCSCKEEQRDAEPPVTNEPTPSAPAATNASVTANEETAVRPEFKPLVGDWLREDGGYVLRIEAVEPDGKLKAGYFNPRPIHVSRAAAVKEDGSIKVGVELNDTGYPGCLYNLVFDDALDQLTGTYFQAAMRQTWPVVFVRQPK